MEYFNGFSISVGEIFKPFAWKADYDMDFKTDCLYCNGDMLKGYHVEDEYGNSGRIAICTFCDKVNARY